MFKNCVRAMSVLLAGAIFLSMNMDVQAAGLSDVLPSGGVNIAMAKGTTLEEMSAQSGEATAEITAIVDAASMDALREQQASAAEETAEESFDNVVIAQVTRYVNVRKTPDEKGEILGKLYDESAGELLGEENGWYYIQSGSITGYVKAEYCVTGEEAKALAAEVGIRLATVNCDGLYVRKEADLESDPLRMVALGDELLVLDETDEWVKVDIEEGDGWVMKEFVDLNTEFVQAESLEEERARLVQENAARESARKAAAKKAIADIKISGDSEMGVAVAEYAIQFVGNPYKWGGTSLTNGADCSGFVMKVYEAFGVSLPHSSSADRKQGYAVDGLDNAQPGDLICYSGHVALYIGDGKIVHAASEKSGIKVSDADYRKILAIRRIF